MMDKERIAELRATARQWIETRHVTYAYKLIECLDAIEALAARNAKLEAMFREMNAGKVTP